MCYDRLGEILNKTEKYDPITPALLKKTMAQDSRSVKQLADRWNWDWLGNEAQSNIEKPEEGIAKASVATGLGFLGAGAGNALQGAGAYGAAVPGVSQGSQQAAMLAAQTGEFGAHGLGATMQAASGAEGLGLMGQYGGQLGGNFLQNASGDMGRRYAMKQATGLMGEPQQPPPPPPPPMRPQEPVMSPYMTEEEKRRFLMMQQRGLY